MKNLYLGDLVAGDFRRVQCVAAQDGVVEEAELLLDGPVAGDDEAGDPVAISTGVPTSTAVPTPTPMTTATPGPTPTLEATPDPS